MSIGKIDMLMNEIRSRIYYFKDDICYCLIDIKSIWNLVGFNNNLSTEEIIIINQYISRINKILSETNNEYNFYIVDDLDNEDYFIQKDKELFRIKNDFLDLLYKIKYRKHSESRIFYYKKNNDKWFERLIFIYLKYDGFIPTYTTNLFIFIKKNWKIFTEEERQFIIYVCEDILGGINLDFLSKNLNTWIKMYIIDKNILSDFILI
jgi:hypothetical protein